MSSRPLVSARPAVVSAPRARGAETEAELAPPSGPAAAVVLAAGLACFALGVLSVLTAASDRVSDALTLSERVGDVSGITTLAAAVFLAVWAGLSAGWRRANPSLLRVAAASGGLIALGLLGTFPPVFNLLGG
jgi:hypothetical protein